MKNQVQDLSRFSLPARFRGASALKVQLWWMIDCTLFRLSPQFAYAFRRTLLRLFGAKIGKSVLIRPTVRVTYPWKVEIGDFSWIGDDVTLYSLGPITIGRNAVISQKSYLCAGDHDYTQPTFPIRSHPIQIEDEAWISTDVFIAPGVTVGRGTVIGARSSVFSDMPPYWLCHGTPCKPVRERILAKNSKQTGHDRPSH